MTWEIYMLNRTIRPTFSIVCAWMPNYLYLAKKTRNHHNHHTHTYTPFELTVFWMSKQCEEILHVRTLLHEKVNCEAYGMRPSRNASFRKGVLCAGFHLNTSTPVTPTSCQPKGNTDYGYSYSAHTQHDQLPWQYCGLLSCAQLLGGIIPTVVWFPSAT